MLTSDEIYEVMLMMDINDLQSLCSINTQYNNLCKNDTFWKNKLIKDNLPVYNNPKTINDYLKIKHVNDKALEYSKESYLYLVVTGEELKTIFPEEYYNQLKYKNVDKVQLFFNLFKSGIPVINYTSFINDKRIEMKIFKSSREIITDILFDIAYNYPLIKINY
jgi:hypothetical protein